MKKQMKLLITMMCGLSMFASLILAPTSTFASNDTIVDLLSFVTVLVSSGHPKDINGVESPQIIKEGAIYKMWFDGRGTWESGYYRRQIWYAESTDGVNWTNRQVVIEDSGHTRTVGLAYVLKEDGQYVMYHESYYVFRESLGQGVNRENYISRATSTDGINWVNDMSVFEAPYDANSWDGAGVTSPVVMKEDGQYTMWYGGYNRGLNSGRQSIGRATSSDGINWQNRQMVMEPSESGWDSGSFYPGEVVKESDGTYTMYFFAPNPAGQSIGRAKSVDGITWTDREELTTNADLEVLTLAYWGLEYFKDTDGKEYLYFGFGDTDPRPGWYSKIGRVELKPENSPPIADAGGPYNGDEGTIIGFDASGSSDPDNNITLYEWDLDNDGEYDDASGVSTEFPFEDDFSGAVGLKVTDEYGESDTDTASVTINNVAPTIEAIIAPLAPVNINDQPVSIVVTFSDPGATDTHIVTWNWGDTTSDTQTDVASPASQGYYYGEAGVYTIMATVTDDDGGSANELYNFIVVFDPSAGFVTGGGWINSPEKAYKPDPLLTGKATFGFVSKYKKGANTPDGNTEFQFQAGDLNFHSDHYKWLVVTGSNYAKFMGKGTINGEGIGDDLYRFQIWAGDNAPDTFRIKIWYEEGGDEILVYDNGFDQELGGGSIVIHTTNKK